MIMLLMALQATKYASSQTNLEKDYTLQENSTDHELLTLHKDIAYVSDSKPT